MISRVVLLLLVISLTVYGQGGKNDNEMSILKDEENQLPTLLELWNEPKICLKPSIRLFNDNLAVNICNY